MGTTVYLGYIMWIVIGGGGKSEGGENQGITIFRTHITKKLKQIKYTDYS